MHAPQRSHLEALLTRIRETDAEAQRIMATMGMPARPAIELPAPTPRAPIDSTILVGELPPWTAVELELNVSDDVVTFVGRDLVTGQPRIKIEMAQADASPEWVPWIRRWLERKRRGSLRLVE